MDIYGVITIGDTMISLVGAFIYTSVCLLLLILSAGYVKNIPEEFRILNFITLSLGTITAFTLLLALNNWWFVAQA
jgi:hypothetical protein